MSHSVELHQIRFHPALWSDIESQWRGLLEALRIHTAFLSVDWMSTWFRHFAPALQPEAWVFRDMDGLVVGLTIVTLRRERMGPLQVRSAYLNATGEGRVESEHNVILCLPGREAAVAQSLVSGLLSARVEILRLRGFEPGWAATLAAMWPRGPAWGFSSTDHFVDLRAVRASGKPYLDGLSRNSREQVRRSIRLCQEGGDALACDRIRPNHAAFAELFEKMCLLHEKRWIGRGKPGAFSSSEVRGFHADLAISRDRMSELVHIRAGNKTVGILYMLVHADRVNFYQCGLQYFADGRLKPGLVSHAMAIQCYADAGCEEYDFLAGDPGDVRYKSSLSNAKRELQWSNHARPTLKLRGLDFARRLRSGIIASSTS